MNLELVYWLAMGLGLGLLLLSVLLGDLFDFADVDVVGADVPIAPIFFAATAAFGIGGLLGTEVLRMGSAGSIVTGLLTGIGAGVLTGLLFFALTKAESKAHYTLGDLIGLRGRASLGLGPGRTGRITINYEGMTRALVATSTEEIAPGEEVIVRDVVGNALTVTRPESLGL